MITRLLGALSLSLLACGGAPPTNSVESAGGPKNPVLLKSCRAEVPSNVRTIKEAQAIYNAEQDAYLAVSVHPSAAAPGFKGQDWGRSSSGFNKLNWRPYGEVRGVYSVSTTVPSTAKPGGDFLVIGRSDCDGDGVEATYTATKSLNTTLTTHSDIY
jgi:hypothetical protein